MSGSQLASSPSDKMFPVDPAGELLALPLANSDPLTVGKRFAAARFRCARASRRFARAVRRLVLFLTACASRSDRMSSPNRFHHCDKSPVGLCTVSELMLFHDGGAVIVGFAALVGAMHPLSNKKIGTNAASAAVRVNCLACALGLCCTISGLFISRSQGPSAII